MLRSSINNFNFQPCRFSYDAFGHQGLPHVCLWIYSFKWGIFNYSRVCCDFRILVKNCVCCFIWQTQPLASFNLGRGLLAGMLDFPDIFGAEHHGSFPLFWYNCITGFSILQSCQPPTSYGRRGSSIITSAVPG